MNTKHLKEEGLNVNIRINVDRTNFSEVHDLVDILIHNGLQDLPTGLGHVTAYTEVCSSVAESCLDMEEYAALTMIFKSFYMTKACLLTFIPTIQGSKPITAVQIP